MEKNQFSRKIWLKICRIAETKIVITFELISLWSWTTTRLKEKRLITIDITSIVYTSKNHVKCVMVGENIKVFEKI